MKILYVASEGAPYSASGGLGDVIGALPKSVAAADPSAKCEVILPLYGIETKSESGAQFKVLSLEQYLKVYTASSKDGYRINVRKKKDAEKIIMIRKHLNRQLN